MILITVSKTLLYDEHKVSKDYTFVMAGNPNVGKSSLFNLLTRSNQHTGNWTGKTVTLAESSTKHKGNNITVVDLPGTYSFNHQSEEERISYEFLTSEGVDCVVIVVDSTIIERNLYLVLEVLNITQKAVLCLNFSDEANKLGINIDTEELSLQLGIPVIKTNARKKSGLSKLVEAAIKVSDGEIKTFHPVSISIPDYISPGSDEYAATLRKICKNITSRCVISKNSRYTDLQQKLDYLFTSKLTGIPILLFVFAVIFWLTAFAANYPSELLSRFFDYIINAVNSLFVSINLNDYLRSFIVDGIMTTAGWVVSVMLPPAVIFFPLFAILEDFGYLPRIAFILDMLFKKFGVQGKQSITMLMGLGCNACAVMNCRIMNSKKDRTISTVTNSFIPCNGRIPTLIVLSSVFFGSTLTGITKSFVTAAAMMLLLLLSVVVTLIVSLILSKIIKSDNDDCFVLELPPYRRPDFLKVIFVSLRKKVLYVLSRAVLVSIPTGAIIWILCNLQYDGQSILNILTECVNPIGIILGVDGVILTAFILGFPANEIVIPIVVMSYMSQSVLTDFTTISELQTLLESNGWTVTTAICACVLCLFHFPCSTTCFTIKKETQDIKVLLLSILIPATVGILLCLIINFISVIGVNLSQISFAGC